MDIVDSWDLGVEFVANGGEGLSEEYERARKSAEELWAGIKRLNKKGLYYIDLHTENVLRDSGGMKLVDIEGFLC